MSRTDVASVRFFPERYEKEIAKCFVIEYGGEWCGTSMNLALVSEDVMDILFNLQFIDFLKNRNCLRVDRWMYERMCFGFGHDDNVNYDHGGIAMNVWIIDDIYLSEGKNRDVLDQYYATDVATKSAHRIELYTYKVENGVARVPSVMTAEDAAPFIRQLPKRVKNILEIDEWCSNHPGRSFKVNIAMDRSASARAQEFHLVNKLIVFSSGGGLCMRAAICNAVDALGFEEAARSFWEHEEREVAQAAVENRRPRSRRDFHDFSQVLTHLKGCRIELREMRQWTKSGGEVVDEFFTNRRFPGVFVFRQRKTEGSLHAIAVDNRAENGVIMDGAEAFQMSLRKRSLRCCTADGTELVKSDDLRLVVASPVGTGRRLTKKKSKLAKEIRKAKRGDHFDGKGSRAIEP